MGNRHAILSTLCRVSSMHTREPCQSTKAWSARTSPTSAHRPARASTQKEYRRRTCSNYGDQESGVLGSKLPLGAPSPPTSTRRRTCSLPRFCSQRLEAIHNEIHLGLQTSTAAGIWRGVNTCAKDAEADFVERSSRWVGSLSKSGGSNRVVQSGVVRTHRLGFRLGFTSHIKLQRSGQLMCSFWSCTPLQPRTFRLFWSKVECAQCFLA